jgi:hypothetical protein
MRAQKEGALLIGLYRGERALLNPGDERLKAGDHLVLIAQGRPKLA